MWAQSLGREDPLEEEMAIHSSILAWEIPQTEGPGGLQSIGLHRVRHDQSDLAYITYICIQTEAVTNLLRKTNPASKKTNELQSD